MTDNPAGSAAQEEPARASSADAVRQATVHEFDQASGAGSVITDDGRVIPFPARAFDASPLLTLRVGQRLRVSVEGTPPQVTALTLVTFPA